MPARPILRNGRSPSGRLTAAAPLYSHMAMDSQIDLAFRALGDGTRRRIIAQLQDAGELSAGDIAQAFDSAQPTVSKHLKVLREAGLVSDRSEGRNRLYSLRPGGLDAALGWLERHRRFWAHSVDRLEDMLDAQADQ